VTDECVQSTGGIILKGENRRAQQETQTGVTMPNVRPPDPYLCQGTEYCNLCHYQCQQELTMQQ